MTQSIAPLAVLRGRGIGDALSELVSNLPQVSKTVQALLNGGKDQNEEKEPEDQPKPSEV